MKRRKRNEEQGDRKRRNESKKGESRRKREEKDRAKKAIEREGERNGEGRWVKNAYLLIGQHEFIFQHSVPLLSRPQSFPNLKRMSLGNHGNTTVLILSIVVFKTPSSLRRPFSF